MKNVIRFPTQLRVTQTSNQVGIRYRTIHGYRRAFILAGQGPAILLIHGIGDSSQSWRDLIGSLARNYTVIAPDLLGHGESDKPRPGDHHARPLLPSARHAHAPGLG